MVTMNDDALASPRGQDAGSVRRESVLADRNGLEVLEREECLRLLATATLGRISVTSGGLPVILPVNFRLVGERIAFRTSIGSKLDAAACGAVVAFEVDEIDRFTHTGWSVLVTGTVREVTDPDDLAEVERANVPHWAPAGGDHVVALSTDIVSGRRIVSLGAPLPGEAP
jgi:uncharacterized protein